MSTSAAPPLEQQRLKDEQKLLASGKLNSAVQVTGGFECSGAIDPQLASYQHCVPINVRQLSPNHVVVDYADGKFLLRSALFRVNGVAGKLIRIDLNVVDPKATLKSRINPLYTYAKDLADPNTYHAVASGPDSAAVTAWNGPELPATTEQSWHYVANVWNPEPHTIGFVQRFEEDQAYIAVRVPRPPSYNERFFAGLANRPNVHVVEVGRTPGGRPLLLAEIGLGDAATRRGKPCICMYGGEHADEPDGMWAAEGAINFLTSDSIEARQVLSGVTFLIIPNEDPDATADVTHDHIIVNFYRDDKLPENVAYANWFASWITQGGRIVAVLDVHNAGFAAPTDAACAVMEGYGTRGEIAFSFHQAMLAELKANGLSLQARPWFRGRMPTRLGGWISRRFGALNASYETDSEQPNRHLNIQKMEKLGERMLTAMAMCVIDPHRGTVIRAEVDAFLEERRMRMVKFRPRLSNEDAISFEAELALSDPALQAREKREPISPVPKGFSW